MSSRNKHKMMLHPSFFRWCSVELPRAREFVLFPVSLLAHFRAVIHLATATASSQFDAQVFLLDVACVALEEVEFTIPFSSKSWNFGSVEKRSQTEHVLLDDIQFWLVEISDLFQLTNVLSALHWMTVEVRSGTFAHLEELLLVETSKS